MNFSKPFLENLRANISLSSLIGETVSWDPKKTKSSQGDFWGSCPFHEEKTASFHVDSNKGFYYCFGCHAKGDCFTFLKDNKNLSFLEAVTFLAARAGIPLPEKSYHNTTNNKGESELFQIHEEAVTFYQNQLKTSNGLSCRQYLKSRAITEEAERHFELGYSSNSSNALYEHLRKRKFEDKTIIRSGLCMIAENQSKPFDRFRNRLMFPIKDLRGRTIAFGGRALNTRATAKYLNSPETPLFSKGKVIYNYSNAKSVVRNKAPLLLTEGYMDVITLFQAGFTNAVAPLGTAITEDQLNLIWRLHPEPVVLFDGDKAGKKATSKLLMLALPFLKPDRSLRFGQLPVDQDPDDFLRSEGKIGFLRIVEEAEPAVQLLWSDFTEGRVFDSPERKASLDLRLKETVGQIKDTYLRDYFLRAINDIKKQFFSTTGQNDLKQNYQIQKTIGTARTFQTINPLKETRNSFLGRSSKNLDVELRIKEGTILLGCLNHPFIAHALEEKLSRLAFVFEDLAKIRDALLAELPIDADCENIDFYKKLELRLKFDPLQKLKKIPYLFIHPYLGPNASETNASKAINDAINHHISLLNFNAEIKLAEKELDDSSSESVTDRIEKASTNLQNAIKGLEPKILDNDELRKASIKRLNIMIENKIWLKKK